MEAAYRNLGRACEIEVFAVDRVDVRVVRWEPAGADERLLADENGRQDRHEPLCDEPVEGEPVQSERKEGCVADPVAEAGPGDASRTLHVEASDLGVLLRVAQHRRLTYPAELESVVLGGALRDRVVRRVRDEKPQAVALGLRVGQLAFEPPEILLRRLQLLELLGRRLSLEVRPRPQLVDLRDEGAPALIGAQQRIERVGRAFRASAARQRSASERAALRSITRTV